MGERWRNGRRIPASYILPRFYDARCASPNLETSVTLALSHTVSRSVTHDEERDLEAGEVSEKCPRIPSTFDMLHKQEVDERAPYRDTLCYTGTLRVEATSRFSAHLGTPPTFLSWIIPRFPLVTALVKGFACRGRRAIPTSRRGLTLTGLTSRRILARTPRKVRLVHSLSIIAISAPIRRAASVDRATARLEPTEPSSVAAAVAPILSSNGRRRR